MSDIVLEESPQQASPCIPSLDTLGGRRLLSIAQSNPLQKVIQRLQGECEQLRAEKRDLERQLSQESRRNAKLTSESNEIQRRLMAENQKLQNNVAHFKEKIRESIVALELVNDRLQRAENAERHSHDRCNTLSEIIKDLEADVERARRARTHYEEELERMKEAVDQAVEERHLVLERTEADAKRVRQLWEETLAQHATQQDTAERSRAKTIKENKRLKKELEEVRVQLNGVRTKLQQTKTIANHESSRRQKLEKELSKVKMEVEAVQKQSTHLNQTIQTMKMQLEKERSALSQAEEQLQTALQEVKEAREEALRSDTALQRSLEKLDVLQSEWAASLEAQALARESFEKEVRERKETETKLKNAVETEIKYAEGMKMLMSGHISDYNQVLHSVNDKLTKMRERMINMPECESQTMDAPQRATGATSMSIFAH
jgi:chromosome segregation ATPase